MRTAFRTMLALASLTFTALLASAEPPVTRPVLSDVYPRAFHFRQSEGLASNPRVTFDEWDATFSVLDGIMGKCLDEEIPNRSRRNIEFFTRYKELHPEKMVLLHFNGNARDPRFETGPYHAGHWLYYNGSAVTKDIPAGPGETIIHVAQPALFRTGIGRYDDKNDDVAVCMLDDNGKPDWSRAEQVELLEVDTESKTLRVRRGCFGTKPLAFPAGRGYVAAHVTEGPWGRNANLLWSYNHATTCPRDRQGRTCNDLLVEDLCRWFADDGPLAAFDGLEFDVLHFYPHGSGGGRAPDVDADGSPDGGLVDGVSAYGVGVHHFLTALRRRLGDDRLIMADGHASHHQRSIGILNGIESEGWPTLMDTTVSDWSGGLNRHAFWTSCGREPRLSYINHKFMEAGKPTEVPFSISRLVLAAAQFTDSAVTFSLLPPKPRGSRLGVWDELVMGAEQRTGWLGRPLGPPRHLAYETPDLLEGADLLSALSVDDDTQVDQDGAWIRMRAARRDAAPPKAVLEGLQVEGNDLVVRCRVKGDSPISTEPDLPQLLRATCRRDGWLVSPTLPPVFVKLRDSDRRPIDKPEPGAQLVYREQAEIDGEKHEAYFAHPPFGPGFGPGYLAWTRRVRVPKESPVLAFCTGLSPAPNPSDGVTFRVEAHTDKGTQTLFEKHHTAFAWERHLVDLTPWAGREVDLTFITDCGPDDHITADHAYWGDVFVRSAGAPSPGRQPSSGPIMTWAWTKPFEATFYFRNVGPGLVNVVFEPEGGAPLWLADVHAYCAQDTMCREFEHGVVLANPSDDPITFGMQTLFPGKRFRRLTATPEQDGEVNNGRAVSDQVTVPPRDALFLVRGASAER